MSDKHFSFSSLSYSCPRRIWKKFSGAKVEVIPNEYARKGKAKHKQMERDKEMERILKGLGISAQTGWQLETEKKIEWKVGEYKLISIPDLFGIRELEDEKEAVVVDIKTRPFNVVYDRDREQLRLYATALFNLYDVDKVRYYIYFSAKKELEYVGTFIGMDADLNEAEILDKIKWMEEIINAKTEPEGEIGGDCQYCEYILSCPKLEHEPDYNDLEGYIKRWWLAKNIVDRSKDRVKAILQGIEKERVQVDDIEAGFFETSVTDVDDVGFLSEVVAHKTSIINESIDKVLQEQENKEIGKVLGELLEAGFGSVLVELVKGGIKAVLRELVNDSVITTNKTKVKQLVKKIEGLSAYVSKKAGVRFTIKAIKNKGGDK